MSALHNNNDAKVISGKQEAHFGCCLCTFMALQSSHVEDVPPDNVSMTSAVQARTGWRLHVRFVSILAAAFHVVQLSTQLLHATSSVLDRTGGQLQPHMSSGIHLQCRLRCGGLYPCTDSHCQTIQNGPQSSQSPSRDRCDASKGQHQHTEGFSERMTVPSSRALFFGSVGRRIPCSLHPRT